MSTGMIVGIIASVVAVIILIWFISTWNRLVRLEENANKSWADIDVLLNQRYDMIPNLIGIVKGYAEHEREIFEQFAQARQAAAGALSRGDVKGVGAAEGMLSGMMPRINMVAEQYPELKADANFLDLQKYLLPGKKKERIQILYFLFSLSIFEFLLRFYFLFVLFSC